MSYRRFIRPRDASWSTKDWIQWLQQQHVAPSVIDSDVAVCCALCKTPTPIGYLGTPYEFCLDCRSTFTHVLDGLIPICYSLRDGFEGMLWRAKNEPLDAWLRFPLGSLLWTFMQYHARCIENSYGGPFDLKVTIPSHNTTRNGVSHLDEIISRVRNFPSEWTREVLVKNHASRAETRRGRIITDLFTASPEVSGKRILLFDDTYTTGGTMGSAAHALKERGATKVVGLTLGRQLRADWSNSRDFVASLGDRELDMNQCAVHATGREDPFGFFFQQSG